MMLAFKENYIDYPVSTLEHQLILNNYLITEIDKIYENFWDDVQEMSSCYFVNLCVDKSKDKILKQYSTRNFYNFGNLQNISLNLPRYAYISHDENKFLELLNLKIKLCSKILLKKYEIIKRRMMSNHLRFCSGTVNGEPLFKLDDQSLSISLVGLNESIKFLTNFELHEDSEAVNLSKKILTEINKFCFELTEKSNKKFILSENTSEKAIYRFTKLDLKRFPRETAILSNNQNYTNSIHFRDGIKIDLLNKVKIQGDFHKFIHEGAIIYISLDDLKVEQFKIKDFMRIICKDSSISHLKLFS